MAKGTKLFPIVQYSESKMILTEPEKAEFFCKEIVTPFDLICLTIRTGGKEET